MTLIPVALPPGVYKNGTLYSSKGRWAESNRVRWHDGAIRPIGGWERRAIGSSGALMPSLTATPATETIRDGGAWRTNAGATAGFFGSNSDLYYMDSDNVVSQITPAGFVGTGNAPGFLDGFGIGAYGTATYGTRRNPSDQKAAGVHRWTFDTWGEDALFSGQDNSNLYSYGVGDAVALVVSGAPTSINGFVVTDQRIVMAIGDAANPRLVSWSDRENRTDWTTTISNEAGTLTLAGTGNLISAHKVLNQVLILSETDAHVAQYIGPPYIYGFNRVGENCAPVSPSAVIVSDRMAIWVGSRNFWVYDGTLRPLPCDVIDFIQEDADPSAWSMVTGTTVSDFSEFWWFYKAKTDAEVASYICYNYLTSAWYTGKLNRTSAFDRGALQSPVMVDEAGFVYNHEQDKIAVDDTYAITGPLELGQGDKNMAIRYIFPDTEVKGAVSMSLLGRAMPSEPEITYGPYTYDNPTPTRALGREIRLRVDGINAAWEVGTMRLDVAPLTGMR